MADRADIERLLSANPIFAGLAEEERRALGERAISRNYIKGQVVVLYGEIWPYLMLIQEGEITATKESGEGRRLLVATLGAGEVFWGLAFFSENAEMPVSLEARSASRLHLWSRASLLPALLEHGSMSWELCRLMSIRMARASAILEEMAFQPVAGRLARFLVELSPEAEDSAITRSLTLDEIGQRVGSTREVVCRFLQRFADQGLIQLTRTEFLIKDRRQLSEMARQAKD